MPAAGSSSKKTKTHNDSKASSNEHDDGTQLTYNETIDAICGFIKTAIHTILCHRQVYPPNVFTRRQRYRVPVWSSRHPGLTTYVEDVIQALKVQIQKNTVQSCQMVIQSVKSGNVLERYRFDLNFILANVPLRDRDFSIPGNMNAHSIELQLRAFMMKLVSLDGALFDLEDPEDLTWALVLDMKEGCQPETDDAKGNEPTQGAWVPFDEDEGVGGDEDLTGTSEIGYGSRPSYLRARRKTRKSFNEDEEEGDDVQIVPVKSLDTGVINLMLYVEEHPTAKRQQNQKHISPSSHSAPSSSSLLRRRKDESGKGKGVMLEDRTGERDIDEPLPRPSSSGVALTKTKEGKEKKVKRKKGVVGETEDAIEPSESSDDDLKSDNDDDGNSSGSGDSIQSVNDFAGYGKGPGGVGMSGVGM